MRGVADRGSWGSREGLDWKCALLTIPKLYFNLPKNTFPLHSIFVCADTGTVMGQIHIYVKAIEVPDFKYEVKLP